MYNLSRAGYTIILCTAIALLVTAIPTGADSPFVKAPAPDATHKCPVCGMYVYRYPDFIASITFNDGSIFFFDGAKDMFKFFFNFAKYSPNHRREDVKFIFVTEYYNLEAIEAGKALYVLGSDVFGPMGHELIPLRSPEDAGQFRKDHKGRRILTFNEITPVLIGQLDGQ